MRVCVCVCVCALNAGVYNDISMIACEKKPKPIADCLGSRQGGSWRQKLGVQFLPLLSAAPQVAVPHVMRSSRAVLRAVCGQPIAEAQTMMAAAKEALALGFL